MKKVCVIGAGVCGLSSAKNLLEAGITPYVFERTSYIGGLWVYTDDIRYDENGLPVHVSIYQGLWTNTPKETMVLPGLDYDSKLNSFLPGADITDYLKEYVKKFELEKYIKLNHSIENVKPKGNSWIVTYKNLRTNQEFVEEFDYVMVCIGHYSVPHIPNIKGLDSFKGEVMHCHDYKNSEKFTGKTVAVLGAGPSGIDIALELTKVCKKVYFSHHSKQVPKMDYSDNIEQKPDIEEFHEKSLKFVDGSHHEIDTILFCTGYLHDYPFLDPSCKINVDDGHVQPLYKHLVNIEHPTMCIVGVPVTVCTFPMFDLQARYFVETIKGNLTLPSKEDMYLHTNEHFAKLWERGVKKKHAHMLGSSQQAYYDSLSDEAKIQGLPPVLAKMLLNTVELLFTDIKIMRKQNFKVIDEDNFERDTQKA